MTNEQLATILQGYYKDIDDAIFNFRKNYPEMGEDSTDSYFGFSTTVFPCLEEFEEIRDELDTAIKFLNKEQRTCIVPQ